jgi:serine/threonine protein kinase
MSLAPGTRLGPYEILAPIGSGGMGEVYKARDTRLNREVAVKVSGERFSDRFEREARAISSLNHPHICTLHDLGSQDGVDYVVMEFLEGETLAQRLKKGPLAPDQVLEYAIQITDALDTAHRHGVIHRDVKPGNIMLTKKGAKLLDFGLAKVRVAKTVVDASKMPTASTPLTGEGMILGTLHYMAPEQLEGREADTRSDLFALGAVIYEMATARKAFEGTNQASLISAIMSSEPPSISTLQSMSPPALDHVVRTCLAKDPEMRWSTTHDVVVELKWIAAAGLREGIPEPVVVQGKRRVLVLYGLLAAVSLAFLVVTFVRFREKSSEVQPIRFSIFPPEKLTFGDLDFDGPPVISPDGSRLAFVGDESLGEDQKLWVRPLTSLVAQPLPGTSHAVYPFWSPDSRYLGFFADGKLKKVSVGGGQPETLCDAPEGRGASWGKGSGGRRRGHCLCAWFGGRIVAGLGVWRRTCPSYRVGLVTPGGLTPPARVPSRWASLPLRVVHREISDRGQEYPHRRHSSQARSEECPPAYGRRCSRVLRRAWIPTFCA